MSEHPSSLQPRITKGTISEQWACNDILGVPRAFYIIDRVSGDSLIPYTSGNCGPGKVDLEQLVSSRAQLESLARSCATKVRSLHLRFDFVTAIYKGGVLFAWEFARIYEEIAHRKVPVITYDPKTKELSGLRALTSRAKTALPFDDVANYGTSFRAAREALSKEGFIANNACAVVDYENPAYDGPPVTAATRLSVLIDRSRYPQKLKDDYYDFLRDPADWQRRFQP